MDKDTNKTSANPITLKLRQTQELYVIFSACTRAPYVLCDPETFDDEVFVFFDLEKAKKEAARFLAEKTPVTVAKLENRQLLLFYTSLYTMGVNAMSVDTEEGKCLVQLSDFVKRAGTDEQPDGKVWVENPALHLTALYYMQEFRKKPGQEADPKLKELQEEIASNFTKGSYVVAVQKEGNGIPLVKLNKEELFQPIFTDILEFQKFNRENNLRPLVIKADKIPQALPKEAKGIVLNPMGVNMPLTITRTK